MSDTFWYGNAFKRAFTELAAGGGTAKTWRVALLAESHVIDPTDVYWSDVSAAEVSGTGYSAGGAALSGVTINYDGTTGTFTIDADSWAPVGMTVNARYAVVYLSTGSAGSSPLVAICDLSDDGANIVVSGLAIHPSGIVSVTVPVPE